MKLKGEVGMAGLKSIQTRFVGIIMIYENYKVSGLESLELALVMKKED